METVGEFVAVAIAHLDKYTGVYGAIAAVVAVSSLVLGKTTRFFGWTIDRFRAVFKGKEKTETKADLDTVDAKRHFDTAQTLYFEGKMNLPAKNTIRP